MVLIFKQGGKWTLSKSKAGSRNCVLFQIGWPKKTLGDTVKPALGKNKNWCGGPWHFQHLDRAGRSAKAQLQTVDGRVILSHELPCHGRQGKNQRCFENFHNPIEWLFWLLLLNDWSWFQVLNCIFYWNSKKYFILSSFLCLILNCNIDFNNILIWC